MADIEIPESALDAVLAAYPAHRYPEIALNLHGILGDAAPHIGAAYLEQARRSITGLLEEATDDAHDANWDPDLTSGERQHRRGIRTGLQAALTTLDTQEADRG